MNCHLVSNTFDNPRGSYTVTGQNQGKRLFVQQNPQSGHSPNHLNLVVVNNVPLFFNVRDGPYMPTLRLLHQYPNIMKKFQVDRGAIRFVLSGANIMCPGLTSPGGAMDDEVEAETPVAIMAEGKQHALAIGFTKMSAKDMSTNKGIGVDNMHYLNDGLWKMEHMG
ncbi:hypothetical protein Leryth_019861 [Lithospermum erythrorhizon]|nr:hypothetical protein Leryth_019861 [Lithospermum erythrorhizon]